MVHITCCAFGLPDGMEPDRCIKSVLCSPSLSQGQARVIGPLLLGHRSFPWLTEEERGIGLGFVLMMCSPSFSGPGGREPGLGHTVVVHTSHGLLVYYRISPLGQFGLLVAMSVRLSVYVRVCPLPMQFFSSSVDWCGASLVHRLVRSARCPRVEP